MRCTEHMQAKRLRASALLPLQTLLCTTHLMLCPPCCCPQCRAERLDHDLFLIICNCCCAVGECRYHLRLFKMAKDSGAVYVDKPVTDKEMLSMALEGVADLRQEMQQGLLELRQAAQKQLAAGGTPPASAAAAASGPSAAAAGGSGGEAGLQQLPGRQPVTEEEELAAILQQLKSGPDALSAAQLAVLQQQREGLVAADERAGQTAAQEEVRILPASLSESCLQAI